VKKEIYSQIFQIEQTHWWYAGRRKIVFDWVFRILDRTTRARILDVGCGTGYNLDILRKLGFSDVYGLDIAPEALYFCEARGLPQVICGDLTDVPFANESFDLVLALDIIEHLEDDLRGLRGMARLLKPGGALVIFTPALPSLWSLQDEVGHHFRRYTTAELKQKTLKTGLEIVKLSYANSLLFPLVWVGRMILRMVQNRVTLISEADLSPNWSNEILKNIFSTERAMLRRINFPVGVSIFCVCQKPVDEYAG
jgi:SAM-dependent methyltransferase